MCRCACQPPQLSLRRTYRSDIVVAFARTQKVRLIVVRTLRRTWRRLRCHGRTSDTAPRPRRQEHALLTKRILIPRCCWWRRSVALVMNGAPPMAKEEADGGTPPLASTLAPHVESTPLSRKREASTAADDASGTDLLHPFRSLPDIRPAYFYPVDAFAQPEPVPCDPSMTAEVFTGNEGVPVFTPSMEEFRDFYKFCSAIDAWGMKSGIVKVVPPSEWTDALPSLRREDAQRAAQQGVSDPACIERVRIKNSIVQHFLQAGPGIWRQTNVTRTAKVWDAKQWADTCAHPDQRGPSLARARRKVDAALAAEAGDTNRGGRGVRTRSGGGGDVSKREAGSARAPRRTHAKETSPSEWDQFDYEHGWLREAADAESAEASTANGHQSSSASALTPASWDALTCRALEAEYWRGVNMGKPPMYGADLQGTLFDDRTRSWDVGKLDSLLTRLRLRRPLPGVTTPYLYFGMWRASFAWHVEDMDLHSINYIHFGAPKQWYTIRQADRKRFESIMSAAFPIDSRQCPSLCGTRPSSHRRRSSHRKAFGHCVWYSMHASLSLRIRTGTTRDTTWALTARKASTLHCPRGSKLGGMPTTASAHGHRKACIWTWTPCLRKIPSSQGRPKRHLQLSGGGHPWLLKCGPIAFLRLPAGRLCHASFAHQLTTKTSFRYPWVLPRL